MLVLMTIFLLGASKPAANFNFVKVYGKVVGKNLTICESGDSLRVEKLNVEFKAKVDTLIVEIKGDEGIMIGGAGALLGLPHRPIKISLLAITSGLFMDIENLPIKSMNLRLKASSITVIDRENSLPSCDSISITSSVSTLTFIGAGARNVNFIDLHLNSSIARIYFSGLKWNNTNFNSTLSSISLSGLLPKLRISGFLNLKRGLTPPRSPGLTINFIGSFNIIKFMGSF